MLNLDYCSSCLSDINCIGTAFGALTMIISITIVIVIANNQLEKRNKRIRHEKKILDKKIEKRMDEIKNEAII